MWYRAMVRMKETDGRTMTPGIEAARAVTRRMAPGALEASIVTLGEVMDATLTTERMMAVLSVSFALAALLVTGIGLYGTLAYSTARRTNEIGIRMALGAQRVQVVLMVFRENVWSTAMGALAGLGMAMAGARVLSSFLYGTSVRDPWVLAGSVAALGLIASAASLLPAVRAARVDPMVALRAD
jgi:ABC-type antimicrobial peptide transport system permease subunit